VKSGLSKRALVQLSYAIVVTKPLSSFVETYDPEIGNLTADGIANILKIQFDCLPGAIATSLALALGRSSCSCLVRCNDARERVRGFGVVAPSHAWRQGVLQS
jgi:hypothetical protein